MRHFLLPFFGKEVDISTCRRSSVGRNELVVLVVAKIKIEGSVKTQQTHCTEHAGDECANVASRCV